MRLIPFVIALALAAVANAACTHTVGMVVPLTGAAGRYGQAASKAVQLAFSELNRAAGAAGIAGCQLALDLRDDQSQGAVGVDQARQLVDLKKVPAIIGSVISSVTVPVVTSVAASSGVVVISPASSTPSLTTLAQQGKTGGWFFRTITPDSLQGIAAARYALDQGMTALAILYVNNDFGVNLVSEFRRSFQSLGGRIISATAYNPEQSSYNPEVTRALRGDPAALYFVGYPGDGAAVIRTWIQQGGARRFLFNDGMNTEDFIQGVGPQFLEQADGTSSGTVATASGEYFRKAFPAMSGGFDAASPAADRAFDAAAVLGLAIAQAGRFDAASIRDNVRRVTGVSGEAVSAGPEGFRRALDSIRAGRPVHYVGVIGPIEFDKFGDIAGPFRTWKIAKGQVVTVGEIGAQQVQAIRAGLTR